MASSSRLLVHAITLIAVTVPSAPAASQSIATPQDTDRALHLLARATFGPTPSDLAEVLTLGHAAWLDRQLHPEGIADAGLGPRLAIFPVTEAGMADLFSLDRQRQEQQRLARQAAARDSTRGDALQRPPQSMTPDEREMLAVVNPGRMLADLTAAKLVRSVHTERQLQEVMADFWFNHFNVFYGKGIDRLMVYDYQETAIRPHVFGSFEDMLVATAQHPAMLFYLDNWTSSVPDSLNPQVRQSRADLEERLRQIRALTPQQRQRMILNGRLSLRQIERLEQAEREMLQGDQRQQRGINENYARELMELHTLGVDGGYAQDDVVQVARAFTGWTFRRPGGREGAAGRGGRGMAAMMQQPVDAPQFEFRAAQHYPGDKMVLGMRIPASGMEEGLQVLHVLATHPSTARFVATKLVEWFVTDEPAPAYVEELAEVFERTDGDLREVTRALFESERFDDPRYRRSQVKTPFQLVASALRMTDAQVGRSRALLETLRSMGHLPYNEPAPTGYPATREEWVNSGAMLSRMNFGLTLVSGGVDGVSVELGSLADAGGVRLPIIRGPAGRVGGGRGGERAQRMRARGGRAGANAQRALANSPEVSAEWLDGWVAGLTDRLLPGADATRLRQNLVADLTDRQAAGDPTPVLATRALGLVLGSPDFQKR